MIGPLTENDLEEILALEQEAYPRPWSERMFRQEFGNAVGIQRGWRLDGRLVGYVFAWVIFDDLHINNVAVAPGSQRGGIGVSMMEALFEEARSLGARRVSLEVRPSNVAAKALYTKLGFHPIAERKGYYEDTGEDAIILAKGL